MDLQDEKLTCVDCGQEFVYTVSEQELHKSLGYQNKPKRCPACRQAKKMQRSQGGFGGGRGGFEQRGGGDRQLYTATCAECGKEAQVPFKPRGDRPVYCNECFRKRKDSGQA